MDVFITKCNTLIKIFSIDDEYQTSYGEVGAGFDASNKIFRIFFLKMKKKNLSFEMHHYKLIRRIEQKKLLLCDVKL